MANGNKKCAKWKCLVHFKIVEFCLKEEVLLYFYSVTLFLKNQLWFVGRKSPGSCETTHFCSILQVTSVFAADAVARMSGQIGVAVVTAGPGLTNTVTAVKNAQMAESPVLLMGGAAAGILKGRGALQVRNLRIDAKIIIMKWKCILQAS